ncbi:MAG: ABC transporter permease [Clostridiales bacterium]|nr:ABC transporter permease [Clostridiales bacterium]
MAKGFSFKFALNYLSRSKRLYIPYFIASSIAVSIYFILETIISSKSVANLPASDSLKAIFSIGIVTMTVFIAIFMLYINSYLIKKRNHEFGLYNILGLEKRHIAKIIFCESLILNVSSLITGIVSGIVFGKITFLLIVKILGASVEGSKFTLSSSAFIFTIILFVAIDIIISIINLVKINLAKPVDLLKSEKKGEKEVRFVLPLTIIGFLLLGWAYFVALTETNIVKLIYLFILAVIAVIAATYILFIAGSKFIIDKLKKNKKFYYKQNNFISVSGLAHRMKQNAAGLASICILSTMFLVTVSSTTALFFGQAEMLKIQSPHDCQVYLYSDDEIVSDGETSHNQETITQKSIDDFNAFIKKTAVENNIEIAEQYNYSYCSLRMAAKDGNLTSTNVLDQLDDTVKLLELTILPLDDYNKLSGKSVELNDDEFLCITNLDKLNVAEIKGADSKIYKEKEFITNDKLLERYNKNSASVYSLTYAYLVCNNEDDVKNIYSSLAKIVELERDAQTARLSENFVIDYKDGFDYKNASDFASSLLKFDDRFTYNISDIASKKADLNSLFSGLLFLGIFFALIFVVATVLIIYFKQLSEGFDDKERFKILQKVGMDDRAVKKTINKQVLIVFFLPLVTALIHTAVCTKMLVYLLKMFSLFNTGLTITCVAVSALVFAIIYLIVFKITARTYFNIVKWDRENV